MSTVLGNILGLRYSRKQSALAGISIALAVLLLGAPIYSARADTAGATAGVVAPAAPTPAAPTPSGPAAPAAPAVAATPASRFDDDQVRRGPATANPAARTGAGSMSDGYDLPRVLGALAAVIGLIFLLRWLGKRFFSLPTAPGSSRVVQVLSRSVLSPKQQLVLVRVGQRVLVAADNGSQLSPLSEITDPDEVASLIGQLQSEKGSGVFGMSSAKAFSSIFGRRKKSYGVGASDEALSDGVSDAVYEEVDATHDSEEHGESEDSLSGQAGSGGNDNVVAATRHELNGLMEKVRLVSDQFSRT